VNTGIRIGPPSFGSERAMLRGFLDYHRATLAMKCDGLTDAELMVMVQVLLEYGRHNGHADFPRAGVDGTVGAGPRAPPRGIGAAVASLLL
jgi:hypothetical protein